MGQEWGSYNLYFLFPIYFFWVNKYYFLPLISLNMSNMINLLQHIDTNAQTLKYPQGFQWFKRYVNQQRKNLNSFFLIYTQAISKYLKKILWHTHKQ